MRFVARGLHEAGFTVSAVQLAGHCGSVEDLLATGWRDWYGSVESAALLARGSTTSSSRALDGAALALKLAIERPRGGRGVGLYGTPFATTAGRFPDRASVVSAATRPRSAGRDRHVGSYPYGIKNDASARGSSAACSPATAVPRAAGQPWGSLAEFIRLSHHVRRRLRRVRARALSSLDRGHRQLPTSRWSRERACAGRAVLLGDSYHGLGRPAARHRHRPLGALLQPHRVGGQPPVGSAR